MKICFLYNHDAAHQVAHSIGIADELAVSYSEIGVVIAYGSRAIRQEIEKHLSPEASRKVQWLDLALGKWGNRLLAPLNRIFPARRLARLLAGAKFLRQHEIVVSTERTCLMLKRRWRDKGPQFAYIPHGSGDRNVAYHRALVDFDWMLLSGQKLVDQMVAHKLATVEQCRIIGYPKFDILRGRKAEHFFENDNPVFLYNPHFDPVLSSWFDEGGAILRWFANNPQYNLIFAPHVMLFFKSLHVSPEYKKSRRRPDIDPDLFDRPNILIDTNSERLFDMSYTVAADAYIGDVSSQVYEFLYRARPVFFLDTHSQDLGLADKDEEPAYEFWRNGPIVQSANELFALLPRWQAIGAEYSAEQKRLMDYTADRSDPRSAKERGAAALAEIVKGPLP